MEEHLARPASSKAVRLAAAGALVYLLACALAYMDYPLALAPQLDAAENLAMAAEFAAGAPATEPFYRAPLYPWLLSLLPEAGRPVMGLAGGLLCHLGIGALVFLLARRIWSARLSAPLAAALALLNPASIFFSLQLFDMALATLLYLGGVCLLAGPRNSLLRIGIAGGLLGLAVAARPHFLPVALVTPLALLLLRDPGAARRLAAYLPLAAVLLELGLLNLQRSGEFRILPWQGAYNLWAANRPGANGLYFRQATDLSAMDEVGNPARAESILLYKQAHPESGTHPDIDAMNHYWRDRLVDSVLNDPLRLARLWLFKAYAAVNSFEQYNNLTFSFHKQRLPLLRFNPLNWGLLMVMAAAGMYALFRINRRTAGVMTVLILGYGVTLLLYYASARFRLPLVPAMAVLAGGIPSAWNMVRASSRDRLAVVVIVLAAASLTFSNIGKVRSTDTYVQDRLLLANANAELGRDAQAASLAREVLADFPERREALRIYTVSYFNLRLVSAPAADQFGSWEEQRQWVIQQPPTDPVQDVILGVYEHIWGNPQQARYIWSHYAGIEGLAQGLASACLVAAEGRPLADSDLDPLQAALANLLNQ